MKSWKKSTPKSARTSTGRLGKNKIMNKRLDIQYWDENNNSGNGILNELPDICPQCHHKIDPQKWNGFYNSKKIYYENTLEVIFRCPNLDCLEVFIGYYAKTDRATFFFKKTEPIKYQERHFSQTITSISLEFSKIYNQALIAENAKLDQVCGAGYRKALEFLIKDYILKQTKDEVEKEKIRNEYLGNSIKDQDVYARRDQCL